MSLTKKQFKDLKDKVQVERERLLNSFSLDEGRFSISSDDRKDEIDQATADYERSQMLRFRNRDVFYAKKLNAALAKMNKGEYGECEDCGEDIRFERLIARPTADLCITCKDDAEREELGNFIGRQSKSLEKKIDLVTSL